jgi:hypothetical protein
LNWSLWDCCVLHGLGSSYPALQQTSRELLKKTHRVRVGIKDLRKLRTQTYISDLPDSNSGYRSKKIPSCPILLSLSRKGRVGWHLEVS